MAEPKPEGRNLKSAPTRRRNPFEVRAMLQGGVMGTLIATYATLNEAEAAYQGDGQRLIILGPNPIDAGAPTRIYSRQEAGRWIREA